MTDHKAGTREPRHYLSYVREELIGMWKVQAVGETVASHAQRDKKSEEWISRALRKREALRGNHAEAVWPWAFQLGRTPAHQVLKGGRYVVDRDPPQRSETAVATGPGRPHDTGRGRPAWS